MQVFITLCLVAAAVFLLLESLPIKWERPPFVKFGWFGLFLFVLAAAVPAVVAMLR